MGAEEDRLLDEIEGRGQPPDPRETQEGLLMGHSHQPQGFTHVDEPPPGLMDKILAPANAFVLTVVDHDLCQQLYILAGMAGVEHASTIENGLRMSNQRLLVLGRAVRAAASAGLALRYVDVESVSPNDGHFGSCDIAWSYIRGTPPEVLVTPQKLRFGRSRSRDDPPAPPVAEGP